MSFGIPANPNMMIRGFNAFQKALTKANKHHGLDFREQLQLYQAHVNHGLSVESQTGRAAAELAKHNQTMAQQTARSIQEAAKLDVEKAKLALETKKIEGGGWGKKVLTTAAALPVAGAMIGAGAFAVNKFRELRQISGLRDPLSRMAMRRGLARAIKGNYELQSIDPKLLEHRAEMIYAASKTLFDPENTEVLRNLLLSIKGFDGGSLAVLKEISETEKALKAHHMGVKDLVNVGSELF